MISNNRDRATLITGIIKNEPINISIQQSNTWIAVNIPTLGNYHGIIYRTFRNDIQPLRPYASWLGIDIDALVDTIDILNPFTLHESTSRHTIDNIIENTEQPLRTATINRTEAIRTAYRGSTSDIAILLDVITGLTAIIPQSPIIPPVTANFELAFYTTNLNRLMRVTLEAHTLIMEEHHRINAFVDFGANATDNWRFNIVITDEAGQRNTFDAHWSVRTTHSQTTHELVITAGTGWQMQTTRYILTHTVNNGNFNIRRIQSNPHRTDTIATGNYTTRNHVSRNQPELLNFGFTLNSETDKISTTIAITTNRNTHIPRITFINTDEWVQIILQSLRR